MLEQYFLFSLNFVVASAMPFANETELNAKIGEIFLSDIERSSVVECGSQIPIDIPEEDQMQNEER